MDPCIVVTPGTQTELDKNIVAFTSAAAAIGVATTLEPIIGQREAELAGAFVGIVVQSGLTVFETQPSYNNRCNYPGTFAFPDQTD
jgi:hypothetical protein